jgi:hypothetical protein
MNNNSVTMAVNRIMMTPLDLVASGDEGKHQTERYQSEDE